MTENQVHRASTSSLPAVRTCPGVKADGKPCASRILLDDGFCRAHSPNAGVDLREQGRLGGIKSGEVRREQAKSVRDRLREKVEECFDDVWRVFEKGIRATADGEDDLRTQLAAVTSLMAEAYGRPPQAIVGEEEKPLKFVIESAFRRRDDGD